AAFTLAEGSRDDGLRRVDSDGAALTLFGAADLAGMRFDGYLAGGWDGHDTARTILAGASAASATASVRDRWAGAGVSVGVPRSWGALTVMPLVRLDVVRVALEGYREAGAGFLSATVGDYLEVAAEAGLGAEVSYAWSAEEGWLVPWGRLLVERALARGERVPVVLQDAAGTAFTLERDAADPLWLEAGVGLGWWPKPGWGLTADWRADMGRGGPPGHAVTVGGRLRW
ncbi:MAG TPA: autotransporter outer membrane beta-barrel domain-containing protein, partial [Azospirillaceae bacterium]|nr:autotransporter outer membrane beta-barrel domain-containing protein [Azospirillaceae bacterium]